MATFFACRRTRVQEGTEKQFPLNGETNIFANIFAAHIMITTMSRLIRPEGGVNAKRKSSSASVIISVVDVLP